MAIVKKIVLFSCIIMSLVRPMIATQQGPGAAIATWSILALAGIGAVALYDKALEALFPPAQQRTCVEAQQWPAAQKPQTFKRAEQIHASARSVAHESATFCDREQKREVERKVAASDDTVRSGIDEYTRDVLAQAGITKLPADKRPFAVLVEMALENTHQLSDFEKDIDRMRSNQQPGHARSHSDLELGARK